MAYGILEISFFSRPIRLSKCCSHRWHRRRRPLPGGDERTRTADPLLAKQVLSQLSYIPVALQPRSGFVLFDGTKSAPPSARGNAAGGVQTLNGLKSGKDRVFDDGFTVHSRNEKRIRTAH